MPAPPSTTDELLALVAKSDLLSGRQVEDYLAGKKSVGEVPETATELALALLQDGLLTRYQAEQLLVGRWRNFVIGGKYKLLERIGKGGMALVFLCEHQVMKRLVALKLLPASLGRDPELLGRFHREARALSSLDHPNIVGAFDADRDDRVHFLVMEYVDGGDLDQVVQKVGPLSWERSAEYIRQAALGLQHAHESGLVHRDVKPGNLLLDRSGTIKLLDLGLARFFHESTDKLTTGRDVQTLLGTVDYLAPEQALDSHDVDIRADIYGLGATFYFMLTGKALFQGGTVAEKLSWHLHRPPAPISEVRPDLPDGLARIIERMLAKKPVDRYQVPEEVVEALEPWTRTPVPPPDAREFPELSRAARSLAQSSSNRLGTPQARTPGSGRLRGLDSSSKDTRVIEDGTSPGPTPSRPNLETTQVDIPAIPDHEVARKPSSRGLRSRLTLAGMSAGLLGIAAVAGWSVFGTASSEIEASSPGTSPRASHSSWVVTTASTSDHPDVTPPAPVTTDATISLVSESGPARAFDNLRDAIFAAKAGDRVTVSGTFLVDSIELSDVEGVARDVTVEGVVPGSTGQAVRWRGPFGLDPRRPLLDASGLEGFHLKGFLFDGEGRVADLVRLSGRGGGSTLEDLQFQGAARSDVVLRGWGGDSGRPATIRKAQFRTSAPSEAAILIEPDVDRPGLATESVHIVSCRFVGPFQAALLVGGQVEGLEVEQCRFYRSTDGLRFRRGESRESIRVRLANNTFSELQRGIHFETTPRGASSELVVVNNIFASASRIATLDRVSVEPGNVAGRWIWSDEVTKDAVPAGVRHFRREFDLASVPDRAHLDISCDDTFEAWLNGAELPAAPSPHYSQRVSSIDVARHLKVGRNVLAVRGTNRPDRLNASLGTVAGLLAQITTLEGGRGSVLVKTDETWKCSDRPSEGWNHLGFDDRAWKLARPWGVDNAARPWRYTVWDSVVGPQLKAPLEPIKIVACGNLRDYKSWEGYPTLDSERVAIREDDLPKKLGDDSIFLRYPRKHPLATAGPGGVPLGAFDD